MIRRCHQYNAIFEAWRTKQKTMLYGNSDVYMNLYPTEVFSGAAKMQFEGEEYSVPVGYDSCLRMFHGDYMTTPPKEQQDVKLDHIIKISPDEPYVKFKGIPYCVKSSGEGKPTSIE